jgi:hypothetical protein
MRQTLGEAMALLPELQEDAACQEKPALPEGMQPQE